MSALVEASRRINAASTLSEGLAEAATALDSDKTFKALGDLLYEAGEALAEFETSEAAIEEEDRVWTSKATDAMETLSDHVKPLRTLLKDDGALVDAWKAVADVTDCGVDLGVTKPLPKKKKKRKVVEEEDRELFRLLDPEVLAKLVVAALEDDEYHAEIWLALKANFDPPGDE